MYYYLVNQDVSGKVYTSPEKPIYYYDCLFQPGSIIRNGYIINPVGKLQNIILNNCYVDNAEIEGCKIQGDTSIVRSTLLNCNFNQANDIVFNTSQIKYQGKYESSLPILQGTFNNCSIIKCKLIEPILYGNMEIKNSILLYDDSTIISPSKGSKWKLVNTQIINADIDINKKN